MFFLWGIFWLLFLCQLFSFFKFLILDFFKKNLQIFVGVFKLPIKMCCNFLLFVCFIFYFLRINFPNWKFWFTFSFFFPFDSFVWSLSYFFCTPEFLMDKIPGLSVTSFSSSKYRLVSGYSFSFGNARGWHDALFLPLSVSIRQLLPISLFFPFPSLPYLQKVCHFFSIHLSPAEAVLP